MCLPHRVPLYVAGPGVAVNGTRRLASTHLDLTATLLDLAGIDVASSFVNNGKSSGGGQRGDVELPVSLSWSASLSSSSSSVMSPLSPSASKNAPSAGASLDGMSFAAALARGFGPLDEASWRPFAFAENFGSGGVGGSDTWAAVRFVALPAAGDDDANDGNDGSNGFEGVGGSAGSGHGSGYASSWRSALAAGSGVKSHLWCTNQTEVFLLGSDPWELSSVAHTTPRGRALAALTRPLLLDLSTCAGQTCNSLEALSAGRARGADGNDDGKSGDGREPRPLPCYWPVDRATGLPAAHGVVLDRFDP